MVAPDRVQIELEDKSELLEEHMSTEPVQSELRQRQALQQKIGMSEHNQQTPELCSGIVAIQETGKELRDDTAVEITCHVRCAEIGGDSSMSDSESSSTSEEDQAELIQELSDNGLLSAPQANHILQAKNFALLSHYVVVGFVTTLCSGILYGVLLGSMSVDAHVYVTSQTVLLAPWGVKCIFAFLSDQFPILGYKRRYYCAIGHTLVVSVSLLLIALFEEPSDAQCAKTKIYDPIICNENAHLLVLSLMSIVFGLVLADSAADGLMIETAQRMASTKARGNTILTCFIMRVVGAALASTLLAVGFNGRSHLGFFDWELSIQTLFGIAASMSALSSCIWCICETSEETQSTHIRCSHCCIIPLLDNGYDDYTRCETASRRISKLMKMFCTRPFFFFMMFNIFSPAMLNFTSPANEMMRCYWADVQQMQQQIVVLVTSVVYLVTLVAMCNWCRSMSWRRVVCNVTVFCVIVNWPISIVTAFNLYRNQYLFLLQDILRSLPSAAVYLVASLVTVEVSPAGQEATMYGIVTTSHALALPVSRALANVVYGHLPLWINKQEQGALSERSNYKIDSNAFQVTVVASFSLAFCVMLASQSLVIFLPKNKRASATLRIRNADKQSRFYGVATCSIMIVCFVIGITLNIMAIMPNVNCAVWVGGKGCIS